MVLVFINLGGGGRYWWVGPLLGIGISLASTLLQELFVDRRPRPYYSSHNWRLPPRDAEWGSSPAPPPAAAAAVASAAGASTALDLLDWVLLAILAGLVIRGAMIVRQRVGLRGMLRNQGAAAGGPRRGSGAAAARPDFDRVVAALQRLPTETVAAREDLVAEPVTALRQRLERRGLDWRGCVEKAELVERLLQAAADGGGESCVICAEDYAPGDVVRVLPCRHRMHLECIDRWLLKSTEHSAPKGCPCCNDRRWLSA